jgi:alcohol dehydrogenase class IV
LANAKLGAVHGFAGVLGGMTEAPHGAVCGILLPHVMAVNIGALRERRPDSEALRRYREIARIVTGELQATAAAGVAWVDELVHRLAMPSLSAFGISADDFPAAIQKASISSSMQGNPVKLTPDELREILQRAL